ncbi:hypothetical protein A8H36_25550 [Burkholderia thailandensis]|nr:hypothetical protein A8H36_25550 [Burkholderia thailandensis]
MKGTDFSWEEGGEHSSTFLFVHSDHSRDFKIFIGFSTEDGKIFDWTIRSSTEKVRIFNDDAHDHLEVPERFLNYDPESF